MEAALDALPPGQEEPQAFARRETPEGNQTPTKQNKAKKREKKRRSKEDPSGRKSFFFSLVSCLYLVSLAHSIAGACSSNDTLVESLKSGCLRSMRNLVGVRM